jgi:monoamine oxidase
VSKNPTLARVTYRDSNHVPPNSSVNNTLVGSVCFPSYQLNSTGPGVVLASYSSGPDCDPLAAMTDEEHVWFVQQAMVETFGDIAAEQYTGVYDSLASSYNSLLHVR